MSTPFFSVVMPVFNRAHSIGSALESIFMQDWQDFEVIVVDDGSTDDLDAALREYGPRGVKFLKNDENLGVGPTRNRGVRAARGKWILFFDSDNQLCSGALSILYSTITACDEKVAVVHGKSRLIGVSPRLTGERREIPTRWGYTEFLQARHIEEALAVTRREILLRFPFAEGLGSKRECGLLVWYAIGRAGYEFVWTQQVVQTYQISPDSLSGKPYLTAHPEEMVTCNEKILEQFGDDLRRINKNKLITLHQKTAFYCLMAARKSCALRHARIAWKLDRMNPRSCLMIVLCWVGPHAAQRLYPVLASVGA